jgi:alpha-beta hydrolase superfamily lysophospholipase
MRTIAILALVLVACAHTPDLALRPDTAPPEDSTTDTFAARDGTRLLSRHWAAKGEAKAVVVIMHGLKDYSARYAHLASRLVAAGYSVYAFDLRGHGRSAGPRVAPKDWLDYIDDLDRFLTAVEAKEPGKHVYLFGHSMGGAIAALTAERHKPVLAGLMLSGPALAVDAPPLQIAGAVMAGVLSPKFPALKLDNKDFSSDPASAPAMDKDDLISQPPAPASTAAGLIAGIRAIWEGADALTMPVLAMHGTSDKLTAPSGSRALIERIPAKDKTLKIYDGYYHDLVHEPGDKGPRVEADLIAWLDHHESGAPLEAEASYAKHLGGDPRGWTQAVEVEGGIGEGSTFAGRFAAQLARPRPIGWHGALIAQRLGGVTTLALHPLGVAGRFGAAVVGVSGGVSFAGSSLAFALSGGAWLEAPIGPLHLGGFAQLDHTTGASLDFTQAGGSLRLGRDRAYWPHAVAGVGPVVAAGVDHAGSATGWFVMAGLQLYGAD